MTFIKSSVSDFIREIYPNNIVHQNHVEFLYDLIRKNIIDNPQVTPMKSAEIEGLGLPYYVSLKQFLMSKHINAWVSGGFARWIFFHLIIDPTFLERYCELSDSQFEKVISRQLHSQSIDIDIFSHTKNDFLNLQKILVEDKIYVLSTENALNFKMWWNNQINVQFIKEVRFGTQEEILQSFDFINAQISIDFKNDTVLYHPRLIEVEKNRIISYSEDRMNIKNIHVPTRVFKYVSKYRYKNFDKSNGSDLFFFKWIHEHLKTINDSTLTRIQQKELTSLSYLIDTQKWLTPEQLLLLIGVTKSKIDNYSDLSGDMATLAIRKRNQK